MSVPFYVAPEQLMKDRAEFARQGIARGKSVIVLSCDQGIVFIAENYSPTLRKISEIYDRIGFAAVGRYSEFEALRIAGIRQADLRGYAYDRRDVTGRSLANTYASFLGGTFSAQVDKPFEVELAIAELGDDIGSDRLFRITFDGSIEEPFAVVMGGQAEQITDRLAGFEPGDLGQTLKLATTALSDTGPIDPSSLEIAILDRIRLGRTFRRLDLAEVTGLLE